MILKLREFDRISVTNAAGALNPDYEVGDIVVLNDVSLTPARFSRC